MTYTPPTHQLISHEDAVASALEASIDEYLLQRSMQGMIASWDIQLPDEASEFRKELFKTFYDEEDAVFKKCLLGESMLRDSRHPINPIRVEVSEMSKRCFDRYFERARRAR